MELKVTMRLKASTEETIETLKILEQSIKNGSYQKEFGSEFDIVVNAKCKRIISKGNFTMTYKK